MSRTQPVYFNRRQQVGLCQPNTPTPHTATNTARIGSTIEPNFYVYPDAPIRHRPDTTFYVNDRPIAIDVTVVSPDMNATRRGATNGHIDRDCFKLFAKLAASVHHRHQRSFLQDLRVTVASSRHVVFSPSPPKPGPDFGVPNCPKPQFCLGWTNVVNDGAFPTFTGPAAVQRFPMVNNLAMLGRARDVVYDGYENDRAQRMLTVFSATNFRREYDNAGAVIVFGGVNPKSSHGEPLWRAIVMPPRK